jgi:hypothetical protein
MAPPDARTDTIIPLTHFPSKKFQLIRTGCYDEAVRAYLRLFLEKVQ